MNMKYVSKVSIVIVLSIYTLLLSGCAFGNRNVPGPSTPRITQQGFINPNNVTPGVPGVTNYGTTNYPGTTGINLQATQQMTDNKIRSDNIQNQLNKMREITQPGVVVVGNTAIVGFRPSNAAADLNALKNIIADRVKQIDPSITNVITSESPDIINRIRQLADDMKNNRPMQDINNDFMKLLQEIAPAVR